MGLSGKYDFPGIKKQGARTLRASLLSSPIAWVTKGGRFTDLLLEFAANWMANNGLILFNVGAIYVNGVLDQAMLDRALDAGIRQVESGTRLTPEQMREIDDAVIAAADRALPYSRKP